MGFRNGAFAKVWEVEPMGDTSTKLRISTSFKNKKTDQFEQDFSGFVICYGSAVAMQAARLKKGDRIKLGDVDVTTRYDADKKITYTNYKMFSFEDQGGDKSSSYGGSNGADHSSYEGEPTYEGSDVPF